MGLCRVAQQCSARELSANDSEETVATLLSKFELPVNIMSRERCRKLFELKVALEKTWEYFSAE